MRIDDNLYYNHYLGGSAELAKIGYTYFLLHEDQKLGDD